MKLLLTCTESGVYRAREGYPLDFSYLHKLQHLFSDCRYVLPPLDGKKSENFDVGSGAAILSWVPDKMPSQHGNALKRFSRASPQRSPRRSIAGNAARHGIPDPPLASPPRRTTVDRLSKSQQYRIRQLSHRLAAQHHPLLRREGGAEVGPSGAVRDDGDDRSARWKAAMKQVSKHISFGCVQSCV